MRRTSGAPVRRGMLGNLENLGFIFLACLALILGGMLVVRLAQGDVLDPAAQLPGGPPGGNPAGVIPTSSPEPSPAPTVVAALPATVPQDSFSSAAPDGGLRPSPSPTAAPLPVPAAPITASTTVTASLGGATAVDETGGEVELTFTVRNAGTAPAVIVALAAEPSGAMAGGPECEPGSSLAAGADCSFTSMLSLPGGKTGTSVPVVFRAIVAPQASINAPQASGLPAGASQATATLRLTYRDVPPQIAVTAEGAASVPETGGSGTWTVTIRNAASVLTTVDSLVVTPVGTVAAGPCAGAVLAEAETCTVQASLNLAAAAAGSTTNLTFTASAHDAEGNIARDTIGTSVTYADIPPHVAVSVTGPESVPAAGGTAAFRVTVTNDGQVAASVQEIQASPVAGVLSGGCARGAALAPGASCTAQVAVRLPAGEAANPASVAISATVTDREGNPATATQSRSVAYLPAPDAPAPGSGQGGGAPAGQSGTGAQAGQPGAGTGQTGSGQPSSQAGGDTAQDPPPPTDTIAGKHIVELSPVQWMLLGGVFATTLLALVLWLPRRRAELALAVDRPASDVAGAPAPAAPVTRTCVGLGAAARTSQRELPARAMGRTVTVPGCQSGRVSIVNLATGHARLLVGPDPQALPRVASTDERVIRAARPPRPRWGLTVVLARLGATALPGRALAEPRGRPPTTWWSAGWMPGSSPAMA